MRNYMMLLAMVLDYGTKKITRAKIDGEHVHALSLFGRFLDFDLTAGFPIVTTRQIGWKTAAHELIWMLRGETNVSYLHANGVHIWDAWADKNGDLGPVYGAQLRRWHTADGREIDQVSQLVADIFAVKNDPAAAPGRRLILNMWNVGDLGKMALPPCPMMAQFNVTNGRLSCLVTQRSADLFIGLPYDIAVYAMLTHVLARITGLMVGQLFFSIGDAHIYENHIEAVKEQLTRVPQDAPVFIVDWIDSVDDIEISDFNLTGYTPCPPIKAQVAV